MMIFFKSSPLVLGPIKRSKGTFKTKALKGQVLDLSIPMSPDWHGDGEIRNQVNSFSKENVIFNRCGS